MSRDRYRILGLKVAVIGLVIIALDVLCLQAVRMFGTRNMAEFGYFAGLLLAWLLVLLGTLKIRQYHFAFARVMIAAGIMIVVVGVEAIMAYNNVQSNLGNQAYIQFNVMFMNYLTIIGTFYAYYRLLQGASSLAKRNDGTKVALKCDGRGKGSFAIIIMCYILIPISHMFDLYVEYWATGVLGIIALVAQLRLCWFILKSYDLAQGKEIR